MAICDPIAEKHTKIKVPKVIHVWETRWPRLVVSALDSGSRDPGSSPGRGIVLCSWEDILLSQGNLTKYWEVPTMD